jgi:hypothetical protein
MNCGCNNQLNDSAGVASLKELYKKKGAGEITFVEKVTNNLPVLGVGAGLAVLGTVLYGKVSKRR